MIDEKTRAEYQRRAEEREMRRQDLWWALRSRALTNDEMEEVGVWREGINMPCVGAFTYNQAEKSKELGDALMNQFIMQVAARKAGLL